MDLTNWAIVSDARGIYLGKFDNHFGPQGQMTLEPAYQYQCAWQVDPRTGQSGGGRYCFPLDLAPSISRVVVERPCSVVFLSQCDEDDLAEIAGLVKQAEAMRDALTAARRSRRSGIVVASGMPKITPIDGGRA